VFKIRCHLIFHRQVSPANLLNEIRLLMKKMNQLFCEALSELLKISRRETGQTRYGLRSNDLFIHFFYFASISLRAWAKDFSSFKILSLYSASRCRFSVAIFKATRTATSVSLSDGLADFN